MTSPSRNQAQIADARREDVRLMEMVAAGDEHACRVLSLRLIGRVRRLTRQLVSPAADADDAAQLALVQVLRSAGSYRGEASIEHWVGRITARTAVRYARSQRRWYDAVLLTDLPERLHAAPPDAPDALPRDVEDYLGQLSAAHREVLVLKLGQGYTVEEIARTLGLPAGTVKSRLVAARRKLRGLLRRDLRFHKGGIAP